MTLDLKIKIDIPENNSEHINAVIDSIKVSVETEKEKEQKMEVSHDKDYAVKIMEFVEKHCVTDYDQRLRISLPTAVLFKAYTTEDPSISFRRFSLLFKKLFPKLIPCKFGNRCRGYQGICFKIGDVYKNPMHM